MCKPRGISGNGTHMFPIGFHRRCQPASQLAGGPAAATLAPAQPRGGGQQGLEACGSRGNNVGPSRRAQLSSILITHRGCTLQSGQVWESVGAPLPSSRAAPRVTHLPWGQLIQECLPLPAPQACGMGGLTLFPSPRDGQAPRPVLGLAIGSGSGCDPVPLENFRRTNKKKGLLGLLGIRTPPGPKGRACRSARGHSEGRGSPGDEGSASGSS